MDPTNEAGLRRRGRALEEGYFAKAEREQIERLQAERERTEARRSLARKSGLGDESVDFLLDVGILAETLPALDWIPLVEVAWSDRELDIPEKKVLLAAAEEDRVNFAQPAHRLLRSWIEKRPGPTLFDAWGLHVSLAGRTPEQREQILDRASKVAHASGGLLGIGTVSGAESKVLEKIKTLLG